MRYQDENVIIRQVIGMAGIKTVSGYSIRNDFKRHIHTSVCIGLVEEGIRQLWIKGQLYEINAGDLFCINRGEVHQCSSDMPHSYSVILLEPYWVEHFMFSDSDINRIKFTMPAIRNDTKIAAQFIKVFNALRKTDNSLEQRALMFAFFETLKNHSLIKRDDPRKSNPQYVQDVCTYIEENYRRDVSIGELSDLVHISPYHLNRSATKALGISLHEYLIHRKLEESRKLLIEGLSITMVAAEMGFSDQSHFTRSFRRYLGVSPGRFLKANRAE